MGKPVEENNNLLHMSSFPEEKSSHKKRNIALVLLAIAILGGVGTVISLYHSQIGAFLKEGEHARKLTLISVKTTCAIVSVAALTYPWCKEPKVESVKEDPEPKIAFDFTECEETSDSYGSFEELLFGVQSKEYPKECKDG